MHAGIFQGGFEHFSRLILADIARLIDFCPRPCHGDGLIEPLAAANILLGTGGDGFPGTDKILHPIYMIQIQGTNV